MKPLIYRAFTAAGLAADLDTATARPGYIKTLGGPSITSGAGHKPSSTESIYPTRLVWLTSGDVKIRVGLGLDASGQSMYQETVLSGFAGQIEDGVYPHMIIDTGTTADFRLGWERT